jgi:hypothetical protein
LSNDWSLYFLLACLCFLNGSLGSGSIFFVFVSEEVKVFILFFLDFLLGIVLLSSFATLGWCCSCYTPSNSNFFVELMN